VAAGFDPYAVLGVSRDATADQIALARRRLSRQYHPDVNSSPDAAARFDEVQRAFDLLSDPVARSKYDQARGHPAAVPGVFARPAAVNFGRLGPWRPVADATVSVNWTGARPRHVAGGRGGEWWTIVGSASSASSSVIVFHLRAEAHAGLTDGRRQGQFTVTVDGRTVVVPLTAEFSSADQSPAAGAARSAPPASRRPRQALVALYLFVIVGAVIYANAFHPGSHSPAGGGRASAPAPARSETVTASPGQPVKVPQEQTATIGVQPVFTAGRAAPDKAKELAAGVIGPPVLHGFELYLPVAPSGRPSLCLTVTAPGSGGRAGAAFTENPLGTVATGGGMDDVFPAVLPGGYALDPHCTPSGATAMTLGTVTAGNLGVLDGATGSDPGNAMVVFAIHTSGATTTVTYGAVGQAPATELSGTPPADDACVDSGQGSGLLTYWHPSKSLVSHQVAGTAEWLETGILVFDGVTDSRQGSYFHYDCADDLASDAPGIAVP